MAYIATRDTYAMDDQGQGITCRRLVRAGDRFWPSWTPVNEDDVRLEEEPVVVADQPVAQQETTRSRADKNTSKSHRKTGDNPAGDPVAAPGPVTSESASGKRAEHPSRRRASKDAGDTGTDA